MYATIGLLAYFAVSIYLIIHYIRNLREPQPLPEPRKRNLTLEQRTQCVLSDDEQVILTRLEKKYTLQFGEEVVLWQQYRWLVQHGMSPEYVER